MRIPWILIAMLLAAPSYPRAQSSIWEVIFIQSVSDSQKTFTTRTKPEQDQLPGRRASFSIEHASIVAEVIDVGEEFTKWRVTNSLSTVPFHAKDKVIYNPSVKAIWPDPSHSKKSPPGKLTAADCNVESIFQDQFKPLPIKKEQGIKIRLSLGKGIYETVSGVLSTTHTTRSQQQREFTYFYHLTPWIDGTLGIRLDQENNRILSTLIDSIRQYLVIGLRWNLDELYKFPHELSPYSGISLGAGITSSRVNLQRQEGKSYIFPHFYIGISKKFSAQWKTSLEGGLEFIFLEESVQDKFVQRATQLNSTIGLTFSRTF